MGCRVSSWGAGPDQPVQLHQTQLPAPEYFMSVPQFSDSHTACLIRDSVKVEWSTLKGLGHCLGKS